MTEFFMGEVKKLNKIKKVILDTNFLIYCARQKIDYALQIDTLISEAFELVVPEQVINELKKLTEKADKMSDRDAAKLALRLIEHNNVKVIKISGFNENYADRAILSLLEDNYMATLDRGLKKKRNNVIVIEGTKKLVLA
jgi:rRNA-processing protein FCF1